ncbi:uncharacterized protein [Parasteatoda tepidariorum]|uniref:uncharacterized protein n=1 Tax=Parasteatoda tepidariorum TaxID=114398 RepID=UPI0039BD3C4E
MRIIFMIVICELILLLFAISKTNSERCPETYFWLGAENVCLHVSNRKVRLNDMKTYCTNEGRGGKPFLRRLSDDGFKDMAEILWKDLQHVVPANTYIGIKKDSGFGSKKWIFSNDEGSVEQGDYPLWASDPSNYDCGVAEIEEFNVTPYSCGQNAVVLCEKDKDKMPCRHDNYRYIDYHGKCLYLYPQQESYNGALHVCLDGHVFPYKDVDSRKSVASAILSSTTIDGGVFIGLKKEDDGSWKYYDGIEEKERWSGNEKEWDCGMIAFEEDHSFGLFTFSCNDETRIMCEYKGKFQTIGSL